MMADPAAKEAMMDDITAQVRAVAQTADKRGRKFLIDHLRDLATSLEQPQDSAQRLLYSHLPLAALRIGCDIDLFSTLTNAGQVLTIDKLVRETNVDPSLLARLLRYMASERLIAEVDEGKFAANNVTKTFAMPGFQGGVYHYFDYVGPGFKHLPDFLQRHEYKRINQSATGALMSAWGSDLHPFAHYQTQPELFAHFNQFMTVQRLGIPTWLDVYPYAEAAKKATPGKPFFVDVGGGLGHQSIALKDKLLNTPGRFIVQDLPNVLKQATPHSGIEFMPHDFFEPQQVHGASIYYMRNIIHDYGDEQAIQILSHTRDALGPDSVVLIDDMVLASKGVNWQAAQLDMTMLTCFSSLERTRTQWYDLIVRTGLKIVKMYTYTESLGDSVIECVAA